MNRSWILLLICISFHLDIYAQRTSNTVSGLSNIEWIVKKTSDFLQVNNVNIDKSSAVGLYEHALEKTCNLNCSFIVGVTGLELKGKRLNDGQVQLDFATYTEINNKGFIIQRNFENRITPFDSVGFVAGIGNSVSGTSYSFVDENSYSDYSFYRLKQIDLDGRSAYSKIIKVEGYSNPLALQVYPNPVTDGRINIQMIGFKQAGDCKLLITDARGGRVYFRSGLNALAGTLKIETGTLSSGWYLVQVYNQTEKARITFIVR